MVRYLDGRVVSTRGEKFTELKNKEEEERMKNTYVNLKPARKYRFHWRHIHWPLTRAKTVFTDITDVKQ